MSYRKSLFQMEDCDYQVVLTNLTQMPNCVIRINFTPFENQAYSFFQFTLNLASSRGRQRKVSDRLSRYSEIPKAADSKDNSAVQRLDLKMCPDLQ